MPIDPEIQDAIDAAVAAAAAAADAALTSALDTLYNQTPLGPITDSLTTALDSVESIIDTAISSLTDVIEMVKLIIKIVFSQLIPAGDLKSLSVGGASFTINQDLILD